MNVEVLKVARSCGTITVPGGQSKDGGCESTRLPIQVESHKTRPRAWPDWRRGGLSRLAAGLISSAACYLTHLLPSSRRAASLDKHTINVCRRPKGRARAADRPPPARQRGSSADRQRGSSAAGAAGASVQVSAALVALAGSRRWSGAARPRLRGCEAGAPGRGWGSFGQPDGGAEKRLAKAQWSVGAASLARGGRPPPWRVRGVGGGGAPGAVRQREAAGAKRPPRRRTGLRPGGAGWAGSLVLVLPAAAATAAAGATASEAAAAAAAAAASAAAAGGGGGGAWCGRRSAGRRRRAETAQRRQRLAANSGTRGRVDAPAACRWRRPAAASRPRRTATTPHWQGPAFESVRRPGRATARRARVANAAADGTHYRARALPGVTMTETGGGCPVRAGGGTARQRGCGGGGGGKGGLPPPPMPRDGLTVRL